ncbi:MAG: aromatic ring-hydroxylating dioxygenase subunit alpha [Pseudomonadales bacterium]|nr:aromatic ring-hydroxylating dioxygenase subunit alpha [Pseudomonadales bacterium]MCP5186015.1 aromatic ring-hydroxylating dioxygenase subunit alpha [Pseudomonadales bacterium]
MQNVVDIARADDRSLPDWPVQSLRGNRLAGERYTSREFFQQEWDHMWTRVWLLLGRESEIPNPGDWQCEEVGPESILMVRQKDGGINAFYNVCQHRGNRLVTGEKGHVNRFVCRYHSWAFMPDGVLAYAQDAEDFPEGDPCGKVNLISLRCETFAGFIWVNMDPECASLREFLGPIWDDWSRYDLHTWKRYVALTTTLPCNWKVVLDNFNESYHVPTVHKPIGTPEERKRMHSGVDTNYRNTRFDLSDEGHNRMIMAGGYAGVSLNSDGTIGEPLNSIMHEWGLNPADFVGKGDETRAALQKAKRTLGPAKGYTHYDKLADEQLTDAFHYTLFPNFAVSLWSDGFHFLRARPHPSDPEQCVFDNWWYASQPEGETAPIRTTVGIVPRDHECRHEVFAAGEKSMGRTIDGDVEIFPLQQAGFHSRGYVGSYLAGQESRIRRYHELIDDYIAGRRPERVNGSDG